jgi:hypothetical protein
MPILSRHLQMNSTKLLKIVWKRSPRDLKIFAALFCIYSLFIILRSSLQGFSASQKISFYPTQIHLGQLVYVLAVPNIFAAQIGFWQQKLAIGQGLLEEFDTFHLNAVLKHEEAHLFFRDTFWFFGLSPPNYPMAAQHGNSLARITTIERATCRSLGNKTRRCFSIS